jgi:hypothetical protein
MSLNAAVLVVGPDSGLACVLLVAVAAAALGLLRAGTGIRPPATPVGAIPRGGPPARGADAGYRALSTARLCRALHDSYASNPHEQSASPDPARIQLRSDLLDEIERRDPAGFHRWLASVPRAGGDPAPYLTPGR